MTIADLSDREREALEHASHGLTAKETAKRLGLARRTVEACRDRAIQKLGVCNISHAVRLLVEFELRGPIVRQPRDGDVTTQGGAGGAA